MTRPGLSGAPDFTCLIPVYHRDAPDALGLAIESVARSTLPPTEIFLCLDGALPEPLERAALAGQNAFGARIVVNSGPAGLHHNLNHAARRVTTPWIARMDADDLNLPQRFERQFAFLRDHPDVDVIGGAILEAWPDGRTRTKTTPQTHAEILRQSLWRNPMNHQTTLFRREAFEAFGPYPDLTQKEDYALWLRLLAAGARFANLPDCLVKVSLGANFYDRRAGLRNLASEWRLYRIKRQVPAHGEAMALVSSLARAGALSAAGPARFFYERFLR